RGGHKTLLVDADLRRPSAHRLFDLPGEPGLGELLRGEAAVADAVQPTRVSRLWLVPAGSGDGHTPQALAQEGVEQIFEELRGQFDYVVLDACPVLPVADALLLARHADGVILSVLRDASRLPRLHAACQRLAMLGVRVLGAVVSGARGDAYTATYHDRTHAAR
ncbi:MAG TPA: CpsD/CapB family tyrosine-protein kinase, partial [Gemmataceae bacterium]|nr:CpsD/CapB family tyrosine-protein kinase [Gemmataceae bacterium]